MKKSSLALSAIMCLAMAVVCFAGCGPKGKIEISLPNNHVSEVTRGETIEFSKTIENVDASDITFQVTGDATITNAGVLTVDTDAEINSTITVVAQTEEVTSNTITLNVIDLAPTSITLSASNDNIALGGQVELTVTSTPNYATLTAYTLSITTGSDIAELTNNVLTLKNSVVENNIIGRTITVKATLTANTAIISLINITVKEASIASIVATHVTYNVITDSAKFLDVKAYNQAGEELTRDLSVFSYTSSNPDVATINENGQVIPTKHGETTITISANGKSTQCDVFVIIPPEQITLNNLSTKITTSGIMAYSMVDALTLDVELSRTGFDGCTSVLDYSFALLNESLQVVEEGNTVATVEDGAITFLKTGKVRVTVTSNSSLNGTNTEELEESASIIVDVNQGININSVADLITYRNQYANIVANIMQDIYLTEAENFGKDASNYNPLAFNGDRTINGNGYVISAERLPLIITSDGDNEGRNMIQFFPRNATTPFTVEIYDLEVVGCGGVNAVYTGELEGYDANEKVMVNPSNGHFIKSFRRGIAVYGEELKNSNSTNGWGYAKNLKFHNVKVSGFDVGMRLMHVVDGSLSDTNISNCFSNGIELVQSILTLHNTRVGQVGAFAIEVTPDDMQGLGTDNITGTAGENYNETPKLTMTGYIDCTNFNNGASTPYMQALGTKLGMSITSLLEAISGAMLSLAQNAYAFSSYGYTSAGEQALAISAAINATLKSTAQNSFGQMSFYLLAFVDKTDEDFQNYDKGNTEKAFVEYHSETGTDSTINMSNIVAAVAQNKNYDGYKAYKYIIMDLNTGSALGNIGQVVLINQAYDPNYEG